MKGYENEFKKGFLLLSPYSVHGVQQNFSLFSHLFPLASSESTLFRQK